MTTRPAEPRIEAGFDRIALRNVRCFKDAEVPLDPRVTVIIGENGAGKTTIAEALASLCAGDGEGLDAFPLRRGAREGAMALHTAGGVDAAAAAASWSAGAAAARRRLPDSAYLFAYGRYRRVQYPDEPIRAPGPAILGPEWDDARDAGPEKNLSAAVLGRRTTTLSRPDSHLLRDVGRQIVRLWGLSSADPIYAEAWSRLDASVRDLGEGLEGIGVVERADRDVAVVRRRGLELELRELSDGYQAILVIVLDLVFRYVFLPPALDAPLDRAAMVVIDEIDLHLHPRWQRRVIRQLTGLFRRTQFVLTTHSPAVVQGAIDDGHAVLVLREKSGEATVEALPEKQRRALKGAQLGSVLVEKRLFGVASRYSPKYEAIERKVTRLREKLEAGHATARDREELLARLDKLQELVAEEEERQGKGPLLSELAKAQIAMLKRLSKKSEEAGVVRLERRGVVTPADWRETWERCFAEPQRFRHRAKVFERLALNGEKRRAGFRSYAAEVFVACGDDFPAIWRTVKAIKDALGQMTGGHCAYCQACVEDNAYGHVEHFKPKSLFPTLAYDILNYFYSCERCNLAKGDRWPEEGGYVRPDEGDPAARVSFDRLGEVRAAAGDREAEAMIQDFELNRKGLKKHRRVAIEARVQLVEQIMAVPGLDVEVQREVVAGYLVEPLSRFSGAINENVRRAWDARFPGVPLPAPARPRRDR